MKRQGVSNRNSAGAVGARLAFLLRRTSDKKLNPAPDALVQQRKRIHGSASKGSSSSSGGGPGGWKVAAWILALILAYLVLRVVVDTLIDLYIDVAQVVNWEPPERDA